MYEHADKSWKTRPVVIGQDTVGRTAARFATYAREHDLADVTVILHGGEPLLAGPARLRAICDEFSLAFAGVSRLKLKIHTNAVQLSRRHLDVFREYDVAVSVSLDGDQAANDRHRLDRRYRSSYHRVLRAIDLLRTEEYRHLFGGLLCTVDVANDPVAVHDALTALSPPRIDYLLPHSTWDTPPPRGSSGSATAYAEWLLAVFDRWTEQGRTVRVRTFDSVLSTLRGGPSLTEAMGLAPSDLAVVETDGSFEQVDSLKTAYDGAPATGYHVDEHTFEQVARHPGVQARQRGLLGLSRTCQECPVVQSCGGGLYAHRYSSEREFDNPSVFCEDLRALVDGIAERITDRSLSPAVLDPEALRFARQELDRTLLAYANQRLAGDPDWDETWPALLRLDADRSTAEHLNRVLSHPYLRAALRSAEAAHITAARFARVAVAAAVHAHAPLRLAWEQGDREMHLPTLGTLTLPAPGRVEAVVSARGLDVHTADGTRLAVRDQLTDFWRPLSVLKVPAAEPLLIDDADPRRAVYPAPVTDPLTPDELAAFRERLRAAYELRAERGLRRRTTGTPCGWTPSPRSSPGPECGSPPMAWADSGWPSTSNRTCSYASCPDWDAGPGWPPCARQPICMCSATRPAGCSPRSSTRSATWRTGAAGPPRAWGRWPGPAASWPRWPNCPTATSPRAARCWRPNCGRSGMRSRDGHDGHGLRGGSSGRRPA